MSPQGEVVVEQLSVLRTEAESSVGSAIGKIVKDSTTISPLRARPLLASTTISPCGLSHLSTDVGSSKKEANRQQFYGMLAGTVIFDSVET